MTIMYNKLFRMLEKKKISSVTLMRQANISSNIISRLNHNEYVSLETIENICRVFNCQASDIIEFCFKGNEEIIDNEKNSYFTEIQPKIPT